MSDMLASVDPGIANGLAFKFPDGRYHTCTVKASDLYDNLVTANPAHVALEGFWRSGRIDTAMIHTMEVVGGVKALCHTRGWGLHVQQNQNRKAFVLDAIEILKAQGRKVVMSKQEDDHEVSALAHLLCMEWKMAGGK